MTQAEQGPVASIAIVVVLVASPVWPLATNEQPNVEHILVLFAVGPVLAGLGVFLLQHYWPVIHPRLVVFPPVRRWWATRTRIFARAQIATILVPLIDEVLDRARAKSGDVLIVGSDGAYLTGEKKRKLHDAIRAWTNRGLTVRYLLVEPDRKALQALVGLRRTLKSSNSLQILPLEGLPDSAEGYLRELVTVLRTLHPTLVHFTSGDDEEKRTMWIESEHLPNEMHSSGNRWVPPEAMRQQATPFETWDDVFSQWKDKLKSLCAYTQPYEVAVA